MQKAKSKIENVNCHPELVSGSSKKTMTETYFVYILTNSKNTVFYIGVTNNLEKRLWEHKNKVISDSFAAKYDLNKLVYYEVSTDINSAIMREKQLKNWHREWKMNLIKSKNPDMIDLSLNNYMFPRKDSETSSE